MRVLQVVSDLDKSNGITNVLMRYFRYLYPNDIEFDFLCFNCQSDDKEKNFFKDEILKLGGRVFYISSPTKFILFYKNWQKFCKIHYQEYDILENNLTFLGFYFRNAKKCLGVKKIITHSHVTKFGDSKFTNIRNRLFWTITGKTLGDILFSCSKEAGQSVFGRKCEILPWYVINNAFEIKEYRFDAQVRKNIRNKMKWRGQYIIGHVGRFTNQKNHKFIVEVFNKFHKLHPSSRLILIGIGPLKKDIVEMVNQMKLNDCVTFLENRSDINDLLQGFDCFIFPSFFEGLGVALVEAQVSGLNCIVSNNVPSEANITDYTSLDLNVGVQKWVEALESAQSKKRISNGYKKAQNNGFDINEEANKLEKIYKRIINF